MDDTNNTAAEVATPDEYDATLVDGHSYTFRGVKYERGVSKTVDAATKEALEKRAVNTKTVDGRFDEDGNAVTTDYQRFTFKKVGEEPAPAPAAPRARTRATR